MSLLPIELTSIKELFHLSNHKISIVIPVYNVEEYIEDCILSIINQSIGINRLEVIFVDDGSTDNSVSVIQEYQKNYPFTLIQIKGPSGAAGKPRNVGLQNTSGKYTVFLDPDDVLEKDGLKLLFDSAEKYQSDVVTGKFIAFSDGGFFDSFERYKDKESLRVEKVNFNVKEFIEILQIPNNLCSKIYRTDFLKNNDIYFPIGVIAQDTYFVTRAYLSTERITFIPQTIFRYRVRNNPLNPSVSQVVNLKYFQDFSYIRKELMNLYQEYPKVNYFDVRYYAELRFLLFQLQRAYSISEEEKYKCLEEVSWFLQYYDQVDTSTLDPERKTMLHSIIKGNYKDAVKFMKINPFLFNKQRAAEIFSDKKTGSIPK